MKVRIGNLMFKVFFLDEKTMDTWNEGDGLTSGFERFVKQELFIRKRLSGIQKRITLLHEINHAIFDYYGIEHDEQLIQTLAVAYFDLLISNDELVSYLKSGNPRKGVVRC